MKSRIMLSMLVIALTAALIGGGTMAWFTAKVDAPENVFTAGTVMIEVGDEVVWGDKMENVNPGDCFLKCIPIKNTGTKKIELRLADVGFEVKFNWDWLYQNWDALCLSSTFDDLPAPTVPFDPDDENWQKIIKYFSFGAENPAFIAPCPESGWAMEYTKNDSGQIVGFDFYYTDGPVDPGETVKLCVVVVFDGELMNNIWQGAEWAQINGVFQAVQASNNAPDAVWDQGWNWAEGLSPAEALEKGTSSAYASYFYDKDGEFKFAGCCEKPAVQ